jgi:hypothetical protein
LWKFREEDIHQFIQDQISNRGRRLSTEAKEFSAFLKMYIASRAGKAGVLGSSVGMPATNAHHSLGVSIRRRTLQRGRGAA